jgi:cell division transport system ATP-binding protein
MAMIELRGAAVSYGSRVVLSDVTLSVGKGELVLIEGATGAGKTTLVRLLLGAVPLQSGSARVLETDLAQGGSDDLTALRRQIGIVFQIARFLERESVLANAALPLALRGDSRARQRAEATRVLMDAGLSQAARKRPSQISGGERARLQIARALVHRPYLLFADEPFAHLDPEAAGHAEDLLAVAHARGTTVVITTHRTTRLSERARRLHLENGKLTPVQIP